MEAALGPEDAVGFGEHRVDVLDRAEHIDGHDRVEAIILQRQAFAAAAMPLDLEAPSFRPPHRPTAHGIRRLDRSQLADVGGVVGDVRPGADADLKDVPRDAAERETSMLGHLLRLREIEQPGEHVISVESHRLAQCYTPGSGP